MEELEKMSLILGLGLEGQFWCGCAAVDQKVTTADAWATAHFECKRLNEVVSGNRRIGQQLTHTRGAVTGGA